MRLEHEEQKNLELKILTLLKKYIDTNQYQIFFFGSRVLNRGNERSDIDIGIEGKEALASDILAQIQEEIDEMDILYKIDIVDFKTVSNDFYRVAKKGIEIIQPTGE